jgi:hypothetical protein
MRLSGLAGRIVYALLAGVVTFVVILILGVIISHFDAQVGSILEKYAAVIGLLVGLVYFFTRNPGTPIV